LGTSCNGEVKVDIFSGDSRVEFDGLEDGSDVAAGKRRNVQDVGKRITAGTVVAAIQLGNVCKRLRVNGLLANINLQAHHVHQQQQIELDSDVVHLVGVYQF